MSFWILTIGSSDIQLDNDKTNQAKGRTEQQRSDKAWSYWYTDDLKAEYYDIPFEPKQIFKDKEEAYRIAPRILGEVYKSSCQKVQDEIWSYLTFPLLNTFVQELENHPTPEAIAILLTDQSVIFQDQRQRHKPKSPYWQDTCELKSILQRYFDTQFPNIPCNFISLEPRSPQQSLENWNEVLGLVRDEFRNLEIANQPVKIALGKNVYVSHQAGTPAISSAVQFVSLAKFGDRVKFLVSSEQDETLADTVESSTYLRGIRQEQAKKLLDRHDYAGVQDLIAEYLDCNTKALLEAAIQWNFAEFDISSSSKTKSSSSKQDSFANRLKQHPKFVAMVDNRIKTENWWWTAYESAYLGFVRLKQGDTVEAMFHSFRAVEGLLKTWSDKCHPGELIQTKHPRWQENERWNRNLKPFGQDLYLFLTLKKTVDGSKDIKQNTTPDIFIFGTQSFDRRNDLFHNLKGLQGEEKVFENWRSPNESPWKPSPVDKWKMRVLNCLNFISDQSFASLEEASLMTEVHEELARAIAQL